MCNHLYFVYEGGLKVEKELIIQIDSRFPTSSNEWEKTSKFIKVSCEIKQLNKGDVFGHEELIKIALHKLQKQKLKAS